ncbi:unnamed protein product, partial [Penicillium egyptiacum]
FMLPSQLSTISTQHHPILTQTILNLWVFKQPPPPLTNLLLYFPRPILPL